VPWFLVGTMQIISVFANWSASNQPWWMIGKHLLASYVSGWFLLGAAIGIGASGLVRPARLIDAIATLTVWTAILAVPTILAAYVLTQQYLYVLTPIGHLLPASLPSRATSFGMFFYNWDDFAGLHLPRIALFYPWPTALGFAGVCTIFALLDSQCRRGRILGTLGGIGMVCCSQSRTAMVAVVFCMAVRWALTWPGRLQVLTALGVTAVLLSLWLGAVSPAQAGAALERQLEQSRPEASEARDAVYEASWRGVHQSPLLGHGWPGASTQEDGSVYGDEENPMVVGSHSTISGLLYKGGAITFGAFLLALARIGLALLRKRRFYLSRDGLAVLIAILLTCTNEGLESLVFPTLFVFLWLGTVLLQSDLTECEVAPVVRTVFVFS
jgi:O-antigen ligase